MDVVIMKKWFSTRKFSTFIVSPRELFLLVFYFSKYIWLILVRCPPPMVSVSHSGHLSQGTGHSVSKENDMRVNFTMEYSHLGIYWPASFARNTWRPLCPSENSRISYDLEPYEMLLRILLVPLVQFPSPLCFQVPVYVESFQYGSEVGSGGLCSIQHPSCW